MAEFDIKSFSTPKAGLPDEQNEDAIHVKHLRKNQVMIGLADGASTGVFSRDWARHLVQGIDSAWLKDEDSFASGLDSLRKQFQPEIQRETARRKFLLEGSYATIMAVLVEKSMWPFGKLKLNIFTIGDCNVFVFNKTGQQEHSFPATAATDYGLIPDLYRSSARLQEKTPCTIQMAELSMRQDDILAVVSDPLGEFLLRNHSHQRCLHFLRDIARCRDNQAFRMLMDLYRKTEGMRNDDATIGLLTLNPESLTG